VTSIKTAVAAMVATVEVMGREGADGSKALTSDGEKGVS
jgi:hypothetical protein